MFKNIPWWNTDLGSKAAEAVAKAVTERCVSMGKIAEKFEKRIAEILDVPYVLAVTNGSTALMLALLELGVKPGDEVIVPDRTWIATAHAAHLLGAKVVLVDVDPMRYLMDCNLVEKAITKRTKAIIPVHFNGRACDIPSLRNIADKHNIAIIEDVAQAFYVKSPEGGYLGTHSRVGCFSMAFSKLITAGQGGVLVTRDKKIYDRLRLMRIHGTDNVVDAKWNDGGGNFRFTDVHAAIALTQLDVLDSLVANVLRVHNQYAEGLPKNIQLIPSYLDKGEIPIYAEVLVENRPKYVEILEKNEIQSRPLYPSLHEAVYLNASKDAVYTNSQYYAECALVLPCGPHQEKSDIEKVIQILHNYKL